MNYAIIGSGNEGQALAKAFARKGIEVAIASRRAAEALAPIAKVADLPMLPSFSAPDARRRTARQAYSGVRLRTHHGDTRRGVAVIRPRAMGAVRACEGERQEFASAVPAAG
jgi:3-hydroxyacyl-CoA dehydrogenase